MDTANRGLVADKVEQEVQVERKVPLIAKVLVVIAFLAFVSIFLAYALSVSGGV